MISIIIPCFNNQETLPHCLRAIQQQTFRDIEVIVVDDGSKYPDKIKAVVDQFEVRHFIQQSNHGAPHARNTGFDTSEGEYVIFLDADVTMKPVMLEKMLRALQNSDAAFCYSAFRLGRKIMKYKIFDPKSLKQYNYIHTSSLIKRNSFPRFDEDLKKFQDWDLWLTILDRGGRAVGIDEVLFDVLQHKDDTMSRWLPSIVYTLPWPVLGFTPQVIQNYKAAQQIIAEKHHLVLK